MQTKNALVAAMYAAASAIPSAIERKDDPTGEFKALLQEGRKLFEELKDADQQREENIKTKFDDVLTQDQLKKIEAALEKKLEPLDPINKRIKEAEEKLAKITTMFNRPPGDLTQDEQVALAKEAKAFSSMETRRDQKAVTPDEMLAYKTAFIEGFVRKESPGPDQLKALSVGSDRDGGYLVPPEMHGRIVEFVRETSPMRQFANIETIGTDVYEDEYDLDETAGNWVGETDTRSQTATPELGMFSIPTHELQAGPRATQRILDDAQRDVEAWLIRKVGNKFSRMEATKFVSGNGAAAPRGFLDYTHGTPAGTSTAAFQVVEQTPVGNASGLFPGASSSPGDVFITAIGLMKAPYLNGAVWAMNRSTLAATRKIKDGDSTYLWQQSFEQGTPFNLLGYPVAPFEDMPAMAANSLSIALANFRIAYTIVDRMGMRVLRDPFTNKPFVTFDVTKRVGGDVVNFEAVKLLKFGTSV